MTGTPREPVMIQSIPVSVNNINNNNKMLWIIITATTVCRNNNNNNSSSSRDINLDGKAVPWNDQNIPTWVVVVVVVEVVKV